MELKELFASLEKEKLINGRITACIHESKNDAIRSEYSCMDNGGYVAISFIIGIAICLFHFSFIADLLSRFVCFLIVYTVLRVKPSFFCMLACFSGAMYTYVYSRAKQAL